MVPIVRTLISSCFPHTYMYGEEIKPMKQTTNHIASFLYITELISGVSIQALDFPYKVTIVKNLFSSKVHKNYTFLLCAGIRRQSILEMTRTVRSIL